MAKRSFLVPVAAALAALVAPAVAATHSPSIAGFADTKNEAFVSPRLDADGNKVVSYQKGEDLFQFVIGKSADGEVFAQHSSHSSHASHRSHSSHYSSR